LHLTVLSYYFNVDILIFQCSDPVKLNAEHNNSSLPVRNTLKQFQKDSLSNDYVLNG